MTKEKKATSPELSQGVASSSSAEACDDEPLFRLNIGGKSYCFRTDTVLTCRAPNSLLAALIRADHGHRLVVVDSFLADSQEYYLERNSKVSDYIVDYFLTGKLHKPSDICWQRFREELIFWHLTNVELAPCCSVLADDSRIKESLETERQLDEVECCPELRKVIWHLMENPSSSIFAKVFAFLSISFIFTSITGLILGSMPEFQADNRMADIYHLLLNTRKSFYTGTETMRQVKSDQLQLSLDHPNSMTNTTRELIKEFVYQPTDNPQHWLIVLEYICITWFTIEFIIRYLVAPRKWHFLKRSMNLIDLFTVIPFYLEEALTAFGVNADRLKGFAGAMLVIRVLRVLRMARVFKLARYSSGLQVFGTTLRSSLRELCMLSMFLLTGTIFFSTVMYFVEKDEHDSDFRSIPAACWWCIITVTTVGYGDSLINTTMGKVVAAIASVFGIIILAFPISMVVENFAFAQQQSKVEHQLREAQMAAVANDYLMKRYPSRRKACRDPLNASIKDTSPNAALNTILIEKVVITSDF